MLSSIPVKTASHSQIKAHLFLYTEGVCGRFPCSFTSSERREGKYSEANFQYLAVFDQEILSMGLIFCFIFNPFSILPSIAPPAWDHLLSCWAHRSEMGCQSHQSVYLLSTHSPAETTSPSEPSNILPQYLIHSGSYQIGTEKGPGILVFSCCGFC